MKPKLLILTSMRLEAMEIIKDSVEFVHYWADAPDMVYTGLRACKTNLPVFSPCTGIDHIESPEIIHLDDNWKKNEGYHVTSTAEHTFSLILQLAKKAKMQLSDKRLGIIGLGRIGAHVLTYSRAFKMESYYYDPILLKGFNHYDKRQFLESLLRNSDVITIHVPLDESTKNMITQKEFSMMKSTALLVNTSRQEIVNFADMKNALMNNKIGGYADDFLTSNPTHISSMNNIIQTNHVAGNSIEASIATDCYIARKILEYTQKGSE